MFHNILLLYKQHVFKYLNQIQFLLERFPMATVV
jgi:hypothetical protein